MARIPNQRDRIRERAKRRAEEKRAEREKERIVVSSGIAPDVKRIPNASGDPTISRQDIITSRFKKQKEAEARQIAQQEELASLEDLAFGDRVAPTEIVPPATTTEEQAPQVQGGEQPQVTTEEVVADTQQPITEEALVPQEEQAQTGQEFLGQASDNFFNSVLGRDKRIEAANVAREELIAAWKENPEKVVAESIAAIAIGALAGVAAIAVTSTLVPLMTAKAATAVAAKHAATVATSKAVSAGFFSTAVGKGVALGATAGSTAFGISKLVNSPTARIRSADAALSQIRESITNEPLAVAVNAKSPTDAIIKLNELGDEVDRLEASIKQDSNWSADDKLNPELTTPMLIRAQKLRDIIETTKKVVINTAANPNPNLQEVQLLINQLNTQLASI